MEITGLLSGLFVGIVIGLIARIIVPSMQPIGCLLTIIIGIIGGCRGCRGRVGDGLGLLANVRRADPHRNDPRRHRRGALQARHLSPYRQGRMV